MDLTLKHSRVLGLVRSAIIALLAIALMEPMIYRSGAWISVAYLKEAAKAPLQLLADTDPFGLVALDSEFFWAVPFQSAENRAQMAQSINAIVPGGRIPWTTGRRLRG